MKRTTWTWLSLIALLLTGCVFGTLGRVTVGGQDAQGVDYSRISVTRDGAAIATEPGMTLKKGDVIQTTADTSAWLEFAQADALMWPNTRVEILNPRLFEWFGQLFLRGVIPVSTESGATVVRGTQYVVGVGPLETKVIVIEGSVSFNGQLVRPRQRLVVGKDGSRRLEVMTSDEFNALLDEINRLQSRSEPPMVIDVTGWQQQRATSELGQRGFRTATDDTPAEAAQVGTVVRQQPAGGTQTRGIVHLDIGAASLVVPKLEGQMVDVATESLSGLPLKLERRDVVTGQHPAGTIVKQTPPPGSRALENSTVTIEVEGVSVRVPDLSNLNARQAQERLRQAGLNAVGMERMPGDAQVLEQDPPRGTLVTPGSNVTVRLSTPKPDLVITDFRATRQGVEDSAETGEVETLVQIDLTIANQGRGSAGPFQFAVECTADGQPVMPRYALDDLPPLATRQSGLAAGKRTALMGIIAVPGIPRSLTLRAVVDSCAPGQAAPCAVDESDESNNAQTHPPLVENIVE